MWKRENKKLSMDEGDFGVGLLTKIKGGSLPSGVKVKFWIKKFVNNDRIEILNKTYDVVDNTFNLSLTKEESDLLPSGCYTYGVELFKEGNFLNTIVNNEEFKVKDKE